MDNSYTGSGYDEFFQRDVLSGLSQGVVDNTTQYDFDSSFKGVNASQINGGLFKSVNGKLTVDLDNENFSVSDGAQERVRLGKLPDESYGLLIKDVNGNQLMQISGNTNVMKSPDGSLEINFDNTQLLVKDSTGNTVVLIGKQIGGF